MLVDLLNHLLLLVLLLLLHRLDVLHLLHLMHLLHLDRLLVLLLLRLLWLLLLLLDLDGFGASYFGCVDTKKKENVLCSIMIMKMYIICTIRRLFGARLPFARRQVLADDVLHVGGHHLSQLVRQNLLHHVRMDLLLRIVHRHHIVRLLKLQLVEILVSTQQSMPAHSWAERAHIGSPQPYCRHLHGSAPATSDAIEFGSCSRRVSASAAPVPGSSDSGPPAATTATANGRR